MKHIGKCLEAIQMAFVRMPKELDSPQKKLLAQSILKISRKYANTLAELVTNPLFKQTIRTLETMNIDRIDMQAQDVEKLLQDLEHALYVIDLTLNELSAIAKKEVLDEQDKRVWHRSYDKLVFMIDQKFGGQRGDLRKEFQVALHTSEELKRIVTLEDHLAEFLK